MGARGPKRTPLAILEARGSWLVRDRSEPDAVVGLPKCPEWLTGVAREHWSYLERQLVSSRVVTLDNADALARLCAFRDLWQRLFLKVRGSKRVSGHALSALLKIEVQLQRLEQSFGLTPASRTNVTPVESPENSEDSLFADTA